MIIKRVRLRKSWWPAAPAAIGLALLHCLATCQAGASDAVPQVRAGFTSAATESVTPDNRLKLGPQPLFVIGLSPGLPMDLKTPEGADGWTELADGGINAVRSELAVDNDSSDSIREMSEYIDNASNHGVYVCPFIRKLGVRNSPAAHEQLAHFVSAFREKPGILFWKLTDEPAWGKIVPDTLVTAYDIIKSNDPHHLVWITHAPRGNLESLLPYSKACDVVATDIYPVSEPPGKNSLESNKGLSMVGDFTSRTVALAGAGRVPMMILQVCWSGVVPAHNPKNRLMFPTAREERYMMYQAIINRANGLFFFGLNVGLTKSEEASGLNWAYWRAVLKPLLSEIRPGSEIYPALIAPDTNYPLHFTGAPKIEVRAKELGPYLYIFAAAREGNPLDVEFSGLQDGEVGVLHENRVLMVSHGKFTDTFRAHDVHVYRALRVINPSDFPARTKK